MWTEALQQPTREYFDELPMAAMKRFRDSKFGICMLSDGKYIVLDRNEDSTKKWVYDSIDEMIKDGWALD